MHQVSNPADAWVIVLSAVDACPGDKSRILVAIGDARRGHAHVRHTVCGEMHPVRVIMVT